MGIKIDVFQMKLIFSQIENVLFYFTFSKCSCGS